MVIQSSLSSSISSFLSFASDLGKQQNMDSLCHWSHCGKTWQMSPKCDDCHWDGCRKSISTGEEKSNLSSAGIAVFSRTCSDVPTINNMPSSSTPKKDSHVYKRRKLHTKSLAFLSEENATEGAKGSAGYPSSISSEHQPLTVRKDDLQRAPMTFVGGCARDRLGNGISLIPGQYRTHNPGTLQVNDARSLESVLESVLNSRCSNGKGQVPAEASVDDLHKSASKHSYSVYDSCSSSKSNIGHSSTLMKTVVEDSEECSSSDVVVVEPLGEFTSVKLCISGLTSHGLLGGVCSASACASLEFLGDDDGKFSLSCKICGLLENPSKMLVCDLCDGAFHIPCCRPRVKKLPVDEWYCQPCFRKKPKPLLENTTGISYNVSEMYDKRKEMSHGNLGPISAMLKDIHPYTTGVRIGKDFQVEIPDWSGPIYEDYDCFGEPWEMSPAECSSLNGWKCNKSSKPSSIGNWVQCRAVIYRDKEETKRIVCGKWRRAPLFVTQTNGWDCSCSVIWDPIHADCAVPQELETDEILKHLKYIALLRPQLASKKVQPSQTRNHG